MAQVTTVAVPDIGGFTDVPVIEVLVTAGQQVAAEDSLIVLESDKATMEVPSPGAGIVKEVLVAVGDTVSEGSPIAALEVQEGGARTENGESPQAEPAAPVPEEPVATPGSEEGGGGASAAPAAPPVPPTAGDPPAASAPAPSGGPIYASPSARKLARERGLDLARVTGSGRGGRITREDVERAAAAPAPGAAPTTEAAAGDTREELTRIQKISAARLQQSWREIPHVTQHDEADITELEDFRKRLNGERDDVKITMVALLMKALVASLAAYPRVNATMLPEGEDAITLHRGVHLGFAADTPQGLLVPVIRDVREKGILELAAELSDLSQRARAGKLTITEMQGATFTISSLGGIGGTYFTPIINQPQVAILGVSRSVTKPVWDGSEFVPRLLLPLSFSYDHRVIDGALAARFTTHLAGVLADLRRVLL